jgi:TIR domain
MASGSLYDVFVSYKMQADSKLATSIVDVMESRGLRCFYAPRNIRPGSPSFDDELAKAIYASRTLLVLLTKAIANSPNEIIAEVRTAVNRGVAILPLPAERNAALPAGLQLLLGSRQFLSPHWEGEAWVDQIVESVNQVREHEGIELLERQRRASRSAEQRKTVQRVAVAAGAALLLGAAIYALVALGGGRPSAARPDDGTTPPPTTSAEAGQDSGGGTPTPATVTLDSCYDQARSDDQRPDSACFSLAQVRDLEHPSSSTSADDNKRAYLILSRLADHRDASNTNYFSASILLAKVDMSQDAVNGGALDAISSGSACAAIADLRRESGDVGTTARKLFKDDNCGPS